MGIGEGVVEAGCIEEISGGGGGRERERGEISREKKRFLGRKRDFLEKMLGTE